MLRRTSRLRSAAVLLAVGGLVAPVAAAAPAAALPVLAAGETSPPAEQDISSFCTNPFAPRFSDVPADSTFDLAIRCIATAQITRGGPDGIPADQYGPERGVPRGQMASFVANLLDAADARDRNRSESGFGGQVQQLPASDGSNAFTDVPDDGVHTEAINRLAQAGVAQGGVGGQPATTYDPDVLVTRAQMASFINRAAAFAQGEDPADAGRGTGYTAPDGADFYSDDEGSVAHEHTINGITSVGIAMGDGDATYDPSGDITRAQMAGFVARTLGQLFDDQRTSSLLEILTGFFAPGARTDQERTIGSDSGDTSVTMNVRDLHAGFLDGDVEYRITLVRCENVTRSDDFVLAVTPDGDTGLADAGAPDTRIVAVGDTEEQQAPPEGTTNSVAARPGENGTLRIDIRNDGEPECVVAVLYVNGAEGRSLGEGGSSPRLEVDDEGRPVEFFGVSGRTTFVEPEDASMTVMTRNIYLGTDIGRPLRPAPEGVPPLIALANQVHEMKTIVEQTDFPTRAGLLAREIVATQPDMIGLQEVATWRRGPLEADPATDDQNRVIPNAEIVDVDFLQVLLGELARSGEPYEVVHVQKQSDVEAPGFRGPNPFAPDAEAFDYRLTMHDVLLKRADSGVVVEAAGGDNYDAVLPFELGGKRFEFVRGYNWADVTLGDKAVRVLNTHLESQLSSFAMLQAQELVETQVLPAGRPVVMTCDCNSDPLDTSTKPGEPIEGIKHQDPYLFLTSVLDDAWIASGTPLPGFTSGLNETVDEPAPASFTHRIDLVLTRGLDGAAVAADQPLVVGDDPGNRSASGLWPSDHAGVVVRLRP